MSANRSSTAGGSQPDTRQSLDNIRLSVQDVQRQIDIKTTSLETAQRERRYAATESRDNDYNTIGEKIQTLKQDIQNLEGQKTGLNTSLTTMRQSQQVNEPHP